MTSEVQVGGHKNITKHGRDSIRSSEIGEIETYAVVPWRTVENMLI